MVRKHLWQIALCLFAAAFVFTVVPALADSGPEGSAGNFTWGQVCIIAGIAVAWGDLRSKVIDHGKRIEELEKDRR